MNIKRQLRAVYAYSFTSALGVTNAVWVTLLAARGYSLAQIGLAEGIFHLVSLLAEVPRGVAADHRAGGRRPDGLRQCADYGLWEQLCGGLPGHGGQCAEL